MCACTRQQLCPYHILKADRERLYHTWEGYLSTFTSDDLVELDKLLFESKTKRQS